MRVSAESELLEAEQSGKGAKGMSGYFLARSRRQEATHAEPEVEELETAPVPRAYPNSACSTAAMLGQLENQLNTLNLAVCSLRDQLHYSEVPSLVKAAGLLHNHSSDLAQYLTSDPKGSLVPRFLEQLAAELDRDHQLLQEQCEELTRQIEQIRETVAARQEAGGACGENPSAHCSRTHETRA